MISAELSLDLCVPKLRDALMLIDGAERTGAQLKAMIDSVCPDLDIRQATGVLVGPGALTSFIRTHLADIVSPVGKHGGDPIYRIGAQRTSLEESENLDFWAIFASTSLGQQFVYNKTTKHIGAQFVGGPVPEDSIVIAPLSSDDLKQICVDFVEGVPESLKNELKTTLNLDNFFTAWVNILRTKYPDYYRDWGLFRVQAIIKLFEDRLKAADLSDEEVRSYVSRLVRNQSAAYRARVAQLTSSPDPQSSTRAQSAQQNSSSGQSTHTPSLAQDLAIRKLATSALGFMSDTELRNLMMPLGALADALKSMQE